jgi:hypothetical protein
MIVDDVVLAGALPARLLEREWRRRGEEIPKRRR